MLPPKALRKALRAYTGTSENIETGAQTADTIEIQACLCRTFIEYSNSEVAIRKVMLDFILPLLIYRRTPDYVSTVFAAVGFSLELPGYKRPKDRIWLGPNVLELIRTIVVSTNKKFVDNILKEYSRASR
jgi:hypothetical protein